MYSAPHEVKSNEFEVEHIARLLFFQDFLMWWCAWVSLQITLCFQRHEIPFTGSCIWRQKLVMVYKFKHSLKHCPFWHILFFKSNLQHDYFLRNLCILFSGLKYTIVKPFHYEKLIFLPEKQILKSTYLNKV